MPGFVPWYCKNATRLQSGKRTRRAAMLRCIAEPASQGSGYSQAKHSMPRSTLMICKMGTGRTAASRLVVRKSQKIFGQKKPSRPAATWPVGGRWLLAWFVFRFGGEEAIACRRELDGGALRERERGRWLTGCGGEDDQPRPVVLDEFTHDVLSGECKSCKGSESSREE